MSCRWTRWRTTHPAVVDDARTATIYLDLARACRKDDFLWFARSQGVPLHLVEELWQGLQARLRAESRSA